MQETRILSMMDEISSNANTFVSQINSLHSEWDDRLYERVTNSADAVMNATQHFMSSAKSTADEVYRDLRTMQSILANL